MKRARIAASRLCLSACIAGVSFLCQSTAAARCVDDWLAVNEIRDGDNVEFRATNQQAFPITFALRVRSDKQANERGQVVRGTLEGKESERVLVLPQLDAHAEANLRVSCSWTIGSEYAVHDNNHVYRLPYADGQSYRVLQGFGSRFSHHGAEEYAVDFKMDIGTPVHAARGGIVARVEESNDKGCWEDGCGEFANFIVIMHDDGTTGEYYHLQKDGALVEPGDRVVAGQKIGLSGNTGHTALPHLHFAVYRATRGARSQSIPISFATADGIIYKPRRGHRYLAVAERQVGD